MTQFTDQHLSAYIDGELSEPLMAELEDALATNADLAARLKALENANQEFVLAHEDLSDEAIPQAFLDALDQAEESPPADPEIIPFPKRVSSQRPWLMPLAACLVLAIGVGVGTRLAPQGVAADPQMIMAGKVDPGTRVYEVLETVPSGQSADGFKPTLTYATKTGDYCRELETSSNRSLACRDLDGNWTVLAIVETSPSAEGPAYQPASATTDKLLDTLAAELMADIPLSPEDERNLMEGWRNGEDRRQ